MHKWSRSGGIHTDTGITNNLGAGEYILGVHYLVFTVNLTQYSRHHVFSSEKGEQNEKYLDK